MATPQKRMKNNLSAPRSAQYITNEMLSPFISTPLPTSQVEMTLSCRNLLNKDLITKSDPYCVISMKEPWQKQYFEIARTETINDSLNPEWVKKVILNYNFETIQKLKFEIRDEDLNGQYDFLGQFETTLSDIVSFSGRQFIGKLTGASNRDCGEIIIVIEEVMACKQLLQIQFNGENLKKLSWLCSNDPFLVISRSNEDGSYSVVIKTDMAISTQNPTWRPILMRVTTLCNGDFDRNIEIACYDHRSSGDHKLIGTCYTSLRSLCSKTETEFKLNNTEKQRTNSNYKPCGILKVVDVKLIEDLSFLDYIRNGTQLHFAVAIDFTASNGVYTDPQSLHYLCATRLNQYEIALRSVGEIISHYDNSKLYPAFGFGAKLPPSGHVSHQFPLNGNKSHPYCSGVEDILQFYKNTLSQVQLFGPTNFAPVINNTISIAEQFQDGKHYFILLIITDGIISDMHHTKRAIINASRLPISIIIIGVGNADFDAMDELDSDEVKLTVDGRFAERDIVQFVPLRRFLSTSGPYIKCQADLAKEVLAEIPEQLTGFMKSRGYRPENLPTDRIPLDTTNIMPTAPMG